MQKKSDNFSREHLQQLAKSPAGQQLISYLQSQNNAQMEAAMTHAAAGDISQAKAALSGILSDPELMARLKKLTEDSHG